MSTLLGRRRYAAMLAALVLVLGMGTAVAGSQLLRGGKDVIHGCAKKKGGALRVAPTCAKGEKALAWNKTGPQGKPGTNGQDGQDGQDGVVGSLDDLDGTPCDGDGGTLEVSYAGDGKASMVCHYGGTVSVTKVGSDLPFVSASSGLSCAPGEHSCAGDPVRTGQDVTFLATLPSSWNITHFAPADVVPGWTGCDEVGHDYSTIWTASCQTKAPADVEVDFTPFRTWFAGAISASTTPYEQQVEACAKAAGTLVVCNAGTNGIGPNVLTPSGPISTVVVMNGVVTVTTAAAPTPLTYVRTPTYDPVASSVTWTTSGSCKPQDLC